MKKALRKSFRGVLIRVGIAAVYLGAATPLPASAANDSKIDQKAIERRCMDLLKTDPNFRACVEKLVEGLPKLDSKRRELFSERYDPREYVSCRLRVIPNDTACEHFILRRREWPEYWPDPKGPRPKWPDAPKESVHRPFMSAKGYWEALCKAEAGEFVYKSVDGNVIYRVRPRLIATDAEHKDRFVLESPFTARDVEDTDKPQDNLVQPFLGRYLALEVPSAGTAQGFLRFKRTTLQQGRIFQTRLGEKFVRVPYLVVSESIERPLSRYGYTWRGIQRPKDRENGIAGGELAVVDLLTGEILGLRRGFALSGYSASSGYWWLGASRCPEGPNTQFLTQVVKPSPSNNENIQILE